MLIKNEKEVDYIVSKIDNLDYQIVQLQALALQQSGYDDILKKLNYEKKIFNNILTALNNN